MTTTIKNKDNRALKSVALAAAVTLWTAVIGSALVATMHYYSHCSLTVKPTCLFK